MKTNSSASVKALKPSKIRHNDIVKQLLPILEIEHSEVERIYNLGALNLVESSLCEGWLKDSQDAEFVKMTDSDMATFLNGLIVENRGAKEGPKPVPETILNYNIILRKIVIALDLQSESILDLLRSEGVDLSKHELSALFRKPTQAQYKACKESTLTALLRALKARY